MTKLLGRYILTSREYWELRNRKAFLEQCLTDVASYNAKLNEREQVPDCHSYNLE